MSKIKTTARMSLTSSIAKVAELPTTLKSCGNLADGVICHKVMPDRIRTRAYEVFQARDGTGAPGDAISDWLQAECELAGCRCRNESDLSDQSHPH